MSASPLPSSSQVLEEHLTGKNYEEASVNSWINYICEDVMQRLANLNKPFKYAGASVQAPARRRPRGPPIPPPGGAPP